MSNLELQLCEPVPSLYYENEQLAVSDGGYI